MTFRINKRVSRKLLTLCPLTFQRGLYFGTSQNEIEDQQYGMEGVFFLNEYIIGYSVEGKLIHSLEKFQ